jgi:cysteine desulfurase family protein (TIGR01976 family)
MQKSAAARLADILPRIRARFPRIDRDIQGNPRIYLNNGAGTMTLDSAARAMMETFQNANPMPGLAYPAEQSTAEIHWEARRMTSDFLNAGDPAEISFHFSATHALFNLAFSLPGLLSPSHNIVVTDIDHMANISPWEEIWGRRFGAEVRRAGVTEGGELDVDHLLSLVDEDTGLVAVTLASNGFGTIVPLRKLAASVRAKSPRCLICVDAVHHALHGPIDVRSDGCDFLVFSGYKLFGPMLGVLWCRREVLEKLIPYRVETAKDVMPTKMEQGMLPNASLAALYEALGYFVWLGEQIEPGKAGSKKRRSRIVAALGAIAAYEAGLSRRVLEGFCDLEEKGLRCYGITDPARASERDPTFAFSIEGLEAGDIKKRLWKSHGIQIADGNHYSAAVYRHLKMASLNRASFAHYDTMETAETYLSAVGELCQERGKK